MGVTIQTMYRDVCEAENVMLLFLATVKDTKVVPPYLRFQLPLIIYGPLADDLPSEVSAEGQ